MSKIVIRRDVSGRRWAVVDGIRFRICKFERMGSTLWKVLDDDGDVVGFAADLDGVRSVIVRDMAGAERWSRKDGA